MSPLPRLNQLALLLLTATSSLGGCVFSDQAAAPYDEPDLAPDLAPDPDPVDCTIERLCGPGALGVCGNDGERYACQALAHCLGVQVDASGLACDDPGPGCPEVPQPSSCDTDTERLVCVTDSEGCEVCLCVGAEVCVNNPLPCDAPATRECVYDEGQECNRCTCVEAMECEMPPGLCLSSNDDSSDPSCLQCVKDEQECDTESCAKYDCAPLPEMPILTREECEGREMGLDQITADQFGCLKRECFTARNTCRMDEDCALNQRCVRDPVGAGDETSECVSFERCEVDEDCEAISTGGLSTKCRQVERMTCCPGSAPCGMDGQGRVLPQCLKLCLPSEP